MIFERDCHCKGKPETHFVNRKLCKPKKVSRWAYPSPKRLLNTDTNVPDFGVKTRQGHTFRYRWRLWRDAPPTLAERKLQAFKRQIESMSRHPRSNEVPFGLRQALSRTQNEELASCGSNGGYCLGRGARHRHDTLCFGHSHLALATATKAGSSRVVPQRRQGWA